MWKGFLRIVLTGKAQVTASGVHLEFCSVSSTQPCALLLGADLLQHLDHLLLGVPLLPPQGGGEPDGEHGGGAVGKSCCGESGKWSCCFAHQLRQDRFRGSLRCCCRRRCCGRSGRCCRCAEGCLERQDGREVLWRLCGGEALLRLLQRLTQAVRTDEVCYINLREWLKRNRRERRIC